MSKHNASLVSTLADQLIDLNIHQPMHKRVSAKNFKNSKSAKDLVDHGGALYPSIGLWGNLNPYKLLGVEKKSMIRKPCNYQQDMNFVMEDHKTTDCEGKLKRCKQRSVWDLRKLEGKLKRCKQGSVWDLRKLEGKLKRSKGVWNLQKLANPHS
ncbi:hypothetical protein ACFE04_015263 [Oxalis oulophora]